MKKCKFARLCCVLIFVFCALPVFSLSVSAVDEVSQGDFVTVYFSSETEPLVAYVESLRQRRKLSKRLKLLQLTNPRESTSPWLLFRFGLSLVRII